MCLLDKKMKLSRQFKLDNVASIYTAECLAIWFATIDALNNYVGDLSLSILSDSRSALLAIKNSD